MRTIQMPVRLTTAAGNVPDSTSTEHCWARLPVPRVTAAKMSYDFHSATVHIVINPYDALIHLRTEETFADRSRTRGVLLSVLI